MHGGCGRGEVARLQARVERAVVAGGRQLEMPTGIYHRHVLHCVLAPSPLHYKQLCAFLPASIPGGAPRCIAEPLQRRHSDGQYTRARGGRAAAEYAGVPTPEACDAQAVARGPIKQVRRCVRRVSDVLSDVLSDVVKTGKMLVGDKKSLELSLFLLIDNYV